jgi:predicted short-subunit dehydrogenase-like oxidoreductase (DUF2520 family)
VREADESSDRPAHPKQSARFRSGILPCMSGWLKTKPGIAIVGAGNLAAALAVALHAAGYRIDEIISRARPHSLNRARALAREVNASVVSVAQAELRAEIIWFCVPDGEIESAANRFSNSSKWKGKVALHSSGALRSDQLDSLRRYGAAVASVHPLMTFVRGSRPSMERVPFGLEGNMKAVKAARALVRDLRGLPFNIPKSRKEAYHAWGMFASPLFTALLVETERIAGAAGIKPLKARRKMLPILRQTLSNYEQLGAARSFSGPIVRGDVQTVAKHLNVLKKIAGAREVYVALARVALRELPTKNRAALEKILAAPHD